jgi:plasmid stabilization system protein ParE
VQVLFTPSARAQLLELMVDLRDRDRSQAQGIVVAIEERLLQLADGLDDGRPIDSAPAAIDDRAGVRLCYWIRAGVMWILAVMPDSELTVSLSLR